MPQSRTFISDFYGIAESRFQRSNACSTRFLGLRPIGVNLFVGTGFLRPKA